ncbi:MAG: Uncharacterised protein [Methanobacteriota archaeon]|jgi:hypothetical protein|nr:MAG: Uncharacterised protein [Euryarchaeota archaeon]|tara:strand:- start:412 stop:1170 length:759 start_codon:yes stop_codon:yes gene_type:complete
MRAIFIGLIMISCSISGCFGSDSILAEKTGIPGGHAMNCLTSDDFTSMTLHVLYEDGSEPSSIDLLKQRLVEVCDKPDGITIQQKQVDFENTGPWTAEKVRDQRWDLGDDAMDGDTLNWYFLFPNGKYDDDSVLGVAVDGSTVAVFLDSVADAEGFFGRPSADEVERSVTVHEAGHLLGLVNLVYTSPYDHEDPSHPGHSKNEDSVMYWAIESTSVGNFIDGDLPTEFDDEDKGDLQGMADGSIKVYDQITN